MTVDRDTDIRVVGLLLWYGPSVAAEQKPHDLLMTQHCLRHNLPKPLPPAPPRYPILMPDIVRR
jgi:hypothetical protein